MPLNTFPLHRSYALLAGVRSELAPTITRFLGDDKAQYVIPKPPFFTHFSQK